MTEGILVECELQIPQACWRQVKEFAGSRRLKFTRQCAASIVRCFLKSGDVQNCRIIDTQQVIHRHIEQMRQLNIAPMPGKALYQYRGPHPSFRREVIVNVKTNFVLNVYAAPGTCREAADFLSRPFASAGGGYSKRQIYLSFTIETQSKLSA